MWSDDRCYTAVNPCDLPGWAKTCGFVAVVVVMVFIQKDNEFILDCKILCVNNCE